ncbi:MAG: DUF1579 domain-containing protein [bacterium]|nr:DUF1579 domain-containing protein [bacterium]
MIQALVTTAAVSALALPAFAQEPAKELEQFAPMLGHWEGSGDYLRSPGDEKPIAWTMRSHSERILDGHGVLESVTIHFGSSPTPFEAYNLYSWDPTRKQFVEFSVGANGATSFNEAYWVGPGALLSTRAAIVDGEPKIERALMRFDGDEMSVEMAHGVRDQPFFTYLTGALKRAEPDEQEEGESDAERKPVEAASTRDVLKGEMAKLSGLVGKWKLAGKMYMAPETDGLPITAVETVQPALGGAVLHAEIVGDPMPDGFVFESHVYIIWNQVTNRYDQFQIDNRGSAGLEHGDWVGKDLVVSSASRQQGVPAMFRAVLELDKNGGMKQTKLTAMMGSSAPMLMFEATFERMKDESDGDKDKKE